MTSHLILGAGEVGQALHKVIEGSDIRDVEEPEGLRGTYDVLHVAYPWQIPDFVRTTLRYKDHYQPARVVVHSTVPVGTCDEYGFVHSPVRGKHPDLEAGLRAFTKHYGGEDAEAVAVLMEPFFPDWCSHGKAATTEAGKLFELVMYGIEVAMQKEVWAYCRHMDLPFDEVYTAFADSYNEGWLELQQPQFMKPVLKHIPGRLGGHCVIPGAEMLAEEGSGLATTLLTVNGNLGDDA